MRRWFNEGIRMNREDSKYEHPKKEKTNLSLGILPLNLTHNHY